MYYCLFIGTFSFGQSIACSSVAYGLASDYLYLEFVSLMYKWKRKGDRGHIWCIPYYGQCAYQCL